MNVIGVVNPVQVVVAAAAAVAVVCSANANIYFFCNDFDIFFKAVKTW